MRLLFLWLICVPASAASPVLIEENGGQFASPARFGVRVGGTELGFGEEITYRHNRAAVQMDFGGARAVVPLPEGPLPARIHSYRGSDRRHWRQNLSAYSALRYPQLYPGIDLLFHSKAGAMEYDFVVEPRANPKRIQLRFRQARSLSLTYSGDLLVEMADGEVLRHLRPVAYQTIAGERRNIPAFFRLNGDTVSFAVARYEASQPLLIDPVLRFATVMQSPVSQIATDAASNSYVASRLTLRGMSDYDLVYWKFDPQGRLIYKVYLGGLGWEEPGRMAADASGSLFLTGTSNSPDYPVNSSPCRGPNADAILTKLGPTGAILASRCFGGVRTESVAGIGVDSGGFVYLGGTTDSNDFPTTTGVLQTQPRSPDVKSGFAARFDPASLALSASTLLGGFGQTQVNDMVLEPGGAVLLSGVAASAGFRVTAGALLTSPPYSQDLHPFLTRFAPGMAALTYSTFLPIYWGGQIVRIGVDGASQAVIAMNPNGYTIRVMKLNSAGSQLILDKTLPNWSGAGRLEVDAAGNLLMTSLDTNFHQLTADTLQGRSAEVLILKMDPTASNTLYASAIPGRNAMAKFGPGNEILAVSSLDVTAPPLRFPITAGASSEAPAIASPSAEFFGLYRIAVGTAVCNPTVEVSELDLPAGGTTLTVGVNAPANCTWAASVRQSPSGWITLEGKSYGTGNGGVMFTAKPLTAPDTGRRAVISVSPTAAITLSQGQAQGCPIAQLPGYSSATGAAAQLSFALEIPDVCPWTVSSDSAWIKVLSPSSGVGRAAVSYALEANYALLGRTGNITINGQSMSVSQGSCGYSFGGFVLDSRASVQPLIVGATPGCPWTIASNVPWVRLNIAPATVRDGSDVVLAEIDENLTSATRTATFTIAGSTHTMQQVANSCWPAGTVTQSTFPSGGGSGAFTVVAPSACNAIGSIAAPASLTSTATPQAGTGVFSFTVPANTSPVPRAFRATGGVLGMHVYMPLLQEASQPVAPFEDVPAGHPFFSYIAILKDKQVTRGCTFDARRYCPSDTVTRAEMATFLARALNLSGGTVPYFEDVPTTHPHFTGIQAIRAAGITYGCATLPDRYCPDQPLSRGQMAALMIRAISGDNVSFTSNPSFQDVTTAYAFFRHVQRMKELGITLGCTTQTYCPDNLTTRGEMAAFLVRAFLSN